VTTRHPDGRQPPADDHANQEGCEVEVERTHSMTFAAARRCRSDQPEPMSHRLRTLDDLDVDGRRVLLRADFDVPMTAPSAGPPVRVADDARIRAGLTTIQELRRRGARLVIVSGLGRPKDRDPALSMHPVADRLGELAGAPVQFAAGVTGPRVRDLCERLEPGQMLMLENIRFEPGEERGEPALAAALAELVEVYVGDAFAAVDGSHASTSGVAQHLPAVAGRAMEREIYALGAIVDRPARPLVAVLGGTKMREKLGVVRRFVEVADAVCIGGAMCFPFLAARSHSVGYSLCRKDDVESARAALATARGSVCRLELPIDLLVSRWGQHGDSHTRYLDGVEVPDGYMGLDIGADSAARYAGLIAAAATVFWNGPMGRFELPQYARGTRTIADAVASTSAMSVIGGAETVAAVQRFGLSDRVNHVSVGGTAMLAFLEGRPLPGVQGLLRRHT
jgi:phosphoglycerate kinase